MKIGLFIASFVLLESVLAKYIDVECEETKADIKTNICTLKNLNSDASTQFLFHKSQLTVWWFIKEDVSFDSFTLLRVTKSRTKVIPRAFFRQYPRLETLNINGSAVEEWHPMTFVHARSLRSLVLPRNRITLLPRFAFYGAKVLDLIDLEHNKISEIDAYAFIDLQALRTIKLQGNLLKTLSLEFISNDKLSLLDVSENLLTQLHLRADAVCETHLKGELKILAGFNDISDLQIEDSFPVTSLFLPHNQLVGMTTVLNHKSLKQLDLESNPLGVLPLTTFFNLNQLEYLNVNNALSPNLNAAFFARLTHLRHLDISYNNFTSIDWNMLAALSQLEELVMFEHRLSLEDAEHLVTIFPHLKRVWISHSDWDCLKFEELVSKIQERGIKVNEGKGSFETVGSPRTALCVPTLFL